MRSPNIPGCEQEPGTAHVFCPYLDTEGLGEPRISPPLQVERSWLPELTEQLMCEATMPLSGPPVCPHAQLHSPARLCPWSCQFADRHWLSQSGTQESLGEESLWLVPPGSASWAFLLDLERRWGCAEKGAKNNDDLRGPLSSGSQTEIPRLAAPRSFLETCTLGVGPVGDSGKHLRC